MFGRRVYQMVPMDIDEDTLNKISDMTGGKYYRADNAERFQKIYAEIDKLEKTEADVKKFAQHTELFAWLITLGIVLLTVEIALGQTLLRRLP
jgi:Ca-activated chloride channel family protein